MAVQGGPAMNVVVDTSPGAQVEGGSAIPVAVVTGRAVTGNKATRVVVVTNPDHIEGGPAIPVVAAPAGDPVEGGPAMRVYVVAGSLGGAAPVNTSPPTISGTAELAATLTATPGSWSNSPTSYTYQWKRNGGAIGGATASTYALQAADLGTTITVTVTAANASGGASATSAGTNIPSFGLLDKFTTSQSAPLTSPRTCEPGPGTFTITDTSNRLSIAGGRIVSSGSWAAFDPKIVNLASYTRVAGRAFHVVMRRPSGSGSGPFVGVALGSSGLDDVSNTTCFLFRSTGNIDIIEQNGGFSTFNVGTYSQSADVDLWLIMRSIGWFYILNNTLMYVGRLDNATVYDFSVRCNAGVSALTEIETMAYYTSLGGAWITDFGIATDYKATTSANDTIVHTADGYVEHSFVAQTGVTKRILFRYTDDNNCMVCECNQGASTIKIFERVAGVETEKTGGTTTQSFTNGTTYRISIKFNGSEIKTWLARDTLNVIRNNTTSSFNSAATMAKVDHAGTNFASYPVSITVNPQ